MSGSRFVGALRSLPGILTQSPLLTRQSSTSFLWKCNCKWMTLTDVSDSASGSAHGNVRKMNFSTTGAALSAVNMKHIKLVMREDVALVTVDSPGTKVNAVNAELGQEFKQLAEEIKKPHIKSVVLISGKPDCFIAGADINMINEFENKEMAAEGSRSGQETIAEIEKSSKPVVVAIMGSCLGMGMEIAMGCHYRIAVNDKKTALGVPEVLLGILPGAGGTQRLPRLTSVPDALDLLLTGRSIKAHKAKKMGLVDQLIEPLGHGLKPADQMTRDYLEEVAIQTAKDLSTGKLKKTPRKKSLVTKVMDKALEYPMVRDYVFKQAKGKVMKQTGGLYPAPLKILEVAKLGLEKGKKEGFLAESKGFGELCETKESTALIGLFHGQTHCKKNRFGKPQKPPKNLAVLGAGLMGAGIAHVSIDKGYHTVLKDMAEPGLIRGLQQIESGLKTAVKKKKFSSFERDQILSNLVGTLEYEGFDKLDMVIEAVFEDINIKHKVLQEVESRIPESCIFASNTSALPITKIAEGSKRPQNVVGMHYFSPVDKMMLLEIITTDKTSKVAVAAAVDVGLKQGKTVIVVKDGPGFYTTRALCMLISEVLILMKEGVTPKEMDKRTKAMGFPVGSATLIDEVGIDVGAHISEYLGSVFGPRMGMTSSDSQLMQDLVAKGFLGRKSGKGIYIYEEGTKERNENTEALQIFKNHMLEPKLELTDENFRMRLLARFVNEAVLCLQEGIIDNPLEGDIGLVFGLGFPPMLGGPFRYLDIYGADKMVNKMLEFEQVYGDRFKPCQLLLDHANDKKKRFHKS